MAWYHLGDVDVFDCGDFDGREACYAGYTTAGRAEEVACWTSQKEIRDTK